MSVMNVKDRRSDGMSLTDCLKYTTNLAVLRELLSQSLQLDRAINMQMHVILAGLLQLINLQH